jgi:hypothetical protein
MHFKDPIEIPNDFLYCRSMRACTCSCCLPPHAWCRCPRGAHSVQRRCTCTWRFCRTTSIWTLVRPPLAPPPTSHSESESDAEADAVMQVAQVVPPPSPPSHSP